MATKKVIKHKPEPVKKMKIEIKTKTLEEWHKLFPEPETPAGASVLYVLLMGPHAGAIRKATIVDQGGPHERIEVQTQAGDGLPMPLSITLANSSVIFHADQLPGTWHWPPTT